MTVYDIGLLKHKDVNMKNPFWKTFFISGIPWILDSNVIPAAEIRMFYEA